MNYVKALLVSTDEGIVQAYTKEHSFIHADNIIICIAITFTTAAVGLFSRYRDKGFFL